MNDSNVTIIISSSDECSDSEKVGSIICCRNQLLSLQARSSSARPYKCSACAKSFAEEYFLSKHKRFHIERKFKCIICNRGMVSKDSLQKHIHKVHSDKKQMNKRK